MEALAMASIATFLIFLVTPWLMIVLVPIFLVAAIFPSTFYFFFRVMRTNYRRRAWFYSLAKEVRQIPGNGEGQGESGKTASFEVGA